MNHWGYFTTAADTFFTNDTIEIIHVKKKKKKEIEELREIKVYSNHHLVKSRHFWLKDWYDDFFSYDSLGRLVSVKSYSSSGEFLSQVNYSYKEHLITASSSNTIGSICFGRFTLDDIGRITQEEVTLYGKCQGITRFSYVKMDSCEISYTINCDCDGRIIDTSSYRILDKKSLIESDIYYNDSGKVDVIYTYLLDTHYRTVVSFTSIPQDQNDYDPAGITTSYMKYYGKTPDYEMKVDWTDSYSYSRKTESGSTIWRKGHWPVSTY